MPRVECDVETSLSPQQVREALLDFGERRPDIWPMLAPGLYTVLSVGEHEADVEEGTKLGPVSIWTREHYDWSVPSTIRWTARESNFCTPGSYAAVILDARDGGGTRVRIEWERTGTSLVGRALCALVVATGGMPMRQAIGRGLRRLERAG